MTLELNGVQHGEQAVGGLEGIIDDPLVFFRRVASGLGVKLNSGFSDISDSANFETDLILNHILKQIRRGKGSELGIYFSYSSSGVSYSKGNRNKPIQPVLDNLSHNIPHGRPLTSLSLASDSYGFFGDNSKNMIMHLTLWDVEYSAKYSKGVAVGDETMSVVIDQPQPGVFSLRNLNSRMFNDLEMRAVGVDVRLGEGIYDYRTFVHRMLEHFAGVPQDDWHNPQMYSADRGIRQLAPYLGLLFPESEAAALMRQMELRMRSRWNSVPRLGLGLKQLPSPKADFGGYIADGAPLLVEYLHTLGIMSSEEARAVVAQRVMNYVLHQTRFQHSPQEARRILQSLQAPKD